MSEIAPACHHVTTLLGWEPGVRHKQKRREKYSQRNREPHLKLWRQRLLIFLQNRSLTSESLIQKRSAGCLQWHAARFAAGEAPTLSETGFQIRRTQWSSWNSSFNCQPALSALPVFSITSVYFKCSLNQAKHVIVRSETLHLCFKYN